MSVVDQDYVATLPTCPACGQILSESHRDGPIYECPRRCGRWQPWEVFSDS